MPRSGRGGRRSGAPGVIYQNRQDLNEAPRNAGTQPVTAPTGLPYGEHQQLINQQKAAPLPQASGPPQPSTPANLALVPPVDQQAQAEQAAQAFQFQPAPPFARPSERPNEPTMAGAPIGAGPGPEVLNQPPVIGRISDLLGQVAGASASSDLRFLAQQASELGQ